MANDFSKEFSQGPGGLKISRIDGRANPPEGPRPPSVSIDDESLGVSTEFELVGDILQVRVEGGGYYSYAPLVQANYLNNSLDTLLINFSFPHFKDRDAGEVVLGDRIRTVVNYLRTAEDEELGELRDGAILVSDFWKLEGIRQTIQDAEEATRVLLEEVYSDEAERVEAFMKLKEAGWMERFGFELWHNEHSSIGLHQSEAEVLQDAFLFFEMSIEEVVESEDDLGSRAEIRGISLSGFTEDSFEWVEAEGDGGEVLTDRSLSEVGEKRKGKYGKLVVGETVVEVVKAGDGKIIIQFMKDRRKLLVAVPLNAKIESVRELLESETEDPSKIRDLVPFSVQAMPQLL